MRLALLLCMTSLILAVETGVGDRVRVMTDDGRDLSGRLLTPADADPLRLRVETAGLRADISIAAAEVARVSPELSARQRRLRTIARDSQRLGPASSAAQHWAWAEEALALGDRIVWRDQLRSCIERDPDHAAAREALGHVRHEGRWMSETEAKLAQGLIRYQGEWLPAEVAADLAEAERQRREEALVARRERMQEREDRRRRWQAQRSRQNFHTILVDNAYYGSGSLLPWLLIDSRRAARADRRPATTGHGSHAGLGVSYRHRSHDSSLSIDARLAHGPHGSLGIPFLSPLLRTLHSPF